MTTQLNACAKIAKPSVNIDYRQQGHPRQKHPRQRIQGHAPLEKRGT